MLAKLLLLFIIVDGTLLQALNVTLALEALSTIPSLDILPYASEVKLLSLPKGAQLLGMTHSQILGWSTTVLLAQT